MQEEEGCFYISFEDFVRVFNEVYICRLTPKNYIHQRVKGMWKGKTAGGSREYPTFHYNPQYQLYVNKKANVTITLHQSDAILTKVKKQDYKYKFIALWLLKDAGERISKFF